MAEVVRPVMCCCAVNKLLTYLTYFYASLAEMSRLLCADVSLTNFSLTHLLTASTK